MWLDRVHNTIMLLGSILWFPIAVLLWAILTGTMTLCFFGLYVLFYHRCYGWKVVDKGDDFHLIMFRRQKTDECPASTVNEDGPHGPCGMCEVCQAGTPTPEKPCKNGWPNLFSWPG
jgi:hypothetical protein